MDRVSSETSAASTLRPSLPEPVGFLFGGQHSETGNRLPIPGAAGSTIELPTSGTGNLVRRDANDAIVWSASYAGTYGAGAEGWAGLFWLDTTDQAVWAWALDISVAPDQYYLKKYALADGTEALVGVSSLAEGLLSNGVASSFVERAAMGNGDLTYYQGNFKVVLSTADGSIVTTEETTQAGMVTADHQAYRSADESILAGEITTASNYIGDNSIYIQRGGRAARCAIPDRIVANGGGSVRPLIWGDGIVALASLFTSAETTAPRFFARADFDAWLHDVADAHGLPA